MINNGRFKRIIISGATCDMGIELINCLISRGVEVVALCNKNTLSYKKISDNALVKKVFYSLDEIEQIEISKEYKYDVFYHFAWSNGEGRNDWYSQIKNIKYTLDAIKFAKKLGCHTFIGAGSQAEYGRFEGVLKPDTPVFPENGYGMAKLCAGQMSREYAHQLGLKHIWVRILSIYGPNDGTQTMVMSTIEKLKNGRLAEFTKGEQLWDYLYSGDAAEAFRLLGEKGKDGKVYILGSGQTKPLYEYINIIAEQLNGKDLINIGAIPYAEKQVMHLCADISELKNDVGWEPKTEFKNGIKKILESIN